MLPWHGLHFVEEEGRHEQEVARYFACLFRSPEVVSVIQDEEDVVVVAGQRLQRLEDVHFERGITTSSLACVGSVVAAIFLFF